MNMMGMMDSEQIKQLLTDVARIADALDRAIPKPVELTTEEEAELDKLVAEAEAYAANEANTEMAAVIEMMEMSGRHVPDEAYRKLGIEPPARKLPEPPSPEHLSAPQPGTIDRPAEPPKPAEPARPAEPDDGGIVSTRKVGL